MVKKLGKKIIPGKYKSTPNHVVQPNGETFYYTEPKDVPAKVYELLEWLKSGTNDLHPVEIAAILHYRFILIHPFDDGNGRIARLLMNYILMRYGFPPVIIKSKDKSNYLTALSKADGGDINSFIKYIGEQLVWSLELSITAANGDSLEEGEDWKTELKLLKQKTMTDKNSESIKRTKELLALRINDSIMPLFQSLEKELSNYNDFFESHGISLIINNGSKP